MSASTCRARSSAPAGPSPRPRGVGGAGSRGGSGTNGGSRFGWLASSSGTMRRARIDGCSASSARSTGFGSSGTGWARTAAVLSLPAWRRIDSAMRSTSASIEPGRGSSTTTSWLCRSTRSITDSSIGLIRPSSSTATRPVRPRRCSTWLIEAAAGPATMKLSGSCSPRIGTLRTWLSSRRRATRVRSPASAHIARRRGRMLARVTGSSTRLGAISIMSADRSTQRCKTTAAQRRAARPRRMACSTALRTSPTPAGARHGRSRRTATCRGSEAGLPYGSSSSSRLSEPPRSRATCPASSRAGMVRSSSSLGTSAIAWCPDAALCRASSTARAAVGVASRAVP